MIHNRFPLPDMEWPGTAGFWQAAQQRELRVPRCDDCRSWIWYPKQECPSCGSTSSTWTQVSGRGRLHTWAVVRHTFLGAFADMVPYVTALVDLDDAPVRLPALVRADPEALVIDMPVEAQFLPLRFKDVDGEVLAPHFVPVPGATAAS